jgi:hypothetical protein
VDAWNRVVFQIIINNRKKCFMKMMHALLSKPARRLWIFSLCLVFVFASCSKSYDDNNNNNGNPPPPPPSGGLTFSGSFEKSSSQVSTQATGSVTATLDTTNLRLSYSISWLYLSSKPVNMHFHDDGPIIVPIQGFAATTDGSFSDTATLTAQQVTDLKNGKIYAQIHTENYPAGEVLAHLTAK